MTDIVADRHLGDMWKEAVQADPNRTFLTFCAQDGGVREFTYALFNQEINRTANLFLELGVNKGDRVSVQLGSCPEFLLVLFGLTRIGAVMVPLNKLASLPEVRHAIGICNVRLAVIEGHMLPGYHQLQTQEGLLPDGIVVARGAGAPTSTCLPAPYRYEELVAGQPAQLKEQRALGSMDTAQVIFTSGTTAQPKGVELTHANLIFSGIYGVWQTSLRPSDRLLTAMPACHSNFQLAALMPVLAAGATLVLVEHYSAHGFWQQIREHGATVTQCVSMMVRTLMLQPVQPGEQDHQLREILYFLPLTDDEKNAFERRFKVRLMNSYGSTESVTWVITDPPCGPRRWPSVGRVGLGYEARIVDDAGAELPAYGVGEIQVKGVAGRTLMRGYYRDPVATASALDSEGWLHTGDKGYRDADGWFYFVDRKANLIKRAGENISATELELVLSAHPRIGMAAVIGVPDVLRDEAVKAFVVPVPGTTLSVEEVLEHCRTNLAPFKVPSFVELCDSLPYTCSMKVEKRLLR